MVAKDKIQPDNWLWNFNFFDNEKYKANRIKPETIVSFKPYKMVNDRQNGEKQKSKKRTIFEVWLNSFLKFKASVEVKYENVIVPALGKVCTNCKLLVWLSFTLFLVFAA